MPAPFSRLLPCVSIPPVAGVVGAALDERLHQGLSQWLGLCQGGKVPYFTALALQVQLMPFALVCMLVAAFLGTLWAVLRSGTPASARMLLAGHAGCVVATLVAPLACPLVIGAGSSAPWALAAMLASELALTVAIAWALLALSGTRPECCPDPDVRR